MAVIFAFFFITLVVFLFVIFTLIVFLLLLIFRLLNFCCSSLSLLLCRFALLLRKFNYPFILLLYVIFPQDFASIFFYYSLFAFPLIFILVLLYSFRCLSAFGIFLFIIVICFCLVPWYQAFFPVVLFALFYFFPLPVSFLLFLVSSCRLAAAPFFAFLRAPFRFYSHFSL